MNTAASTMAGQILNSVVDNMNNNVRKQILEGLKAKGYFNNRPSCEISNTYYKESDKCK